MEEREKGGREGGREEGRKGGREGGTEERRKEDSGKEGWEQVYHTETQATVTNTFTAAVNSPEHDAHQKGAVLVHTPRIGG